MSNPTNDTKNYSGPKRDSIPWQYAQLPIQCVTIKSNKKCNNLPISTYDSNDAQKWRMENIM